MKTIFAILLIFSHLAGSVHGKSLMPGNLAFCYKGREQITLSLRELRVISENRNKPIDETPWTNPPQASKEYNY